MSNKPITIFEYQRLCYKSNEEGYRKIGKKQFKALRSFVLSNKLKDEGTYLRLGQRSGVEYLQAQNYIGVIQLKDGLTIEILPKIANLKSDDKGKSNTRHIVVKMLRTLRNSSFKKANPANLKTEKMSLLEIFISMFLQELGDLIRRGIKSDYITREENLPVLKGKLLFNQHIKQNLVNSAKFFVSYDNYLPDRIENRLLKTTLLLLYKVTNSIANQKIIREYLSVFDDVTQVYDIKTAFTKTRLGRGMEDYENLMIWSKLFLMQESFTPNADKNIAFSLMFDMNALFESYVGWYVKQNSKAENIYLQHREHHLAVDLNSNTPVFGLVPDIAISNKDCIVIADTKWKVLSKDDKVSKSDLHQMFAYANKYNENDGHCKSVYLIYPYTDNNNIESCYELYKHEGKSVNLYLLFFDLSAEQFTFNCKNKEHNTYNADFLI